MDKGFGELSLSDEWTAGDLEPFPVAVSNAIIASANLLLFVVRKYQHPLELLLVLMTEHHLVFGPIKFDLFLRTSGGGDAQRFEG